MTKTGTTMRPAPTREALEVVDENEEVLQEARKSDIGADRILREYEEAEPNEDFGMIPARHGRQTIPARRRHRTLKDMPAVK
jgi:hypothetical protein